MNVREEGFRDRKYLSDICHLVKCKKKLHEILLNLLYDQADWVLKRNHVGQN